MHPVTRSILSSAVALSAMAVAVPAFAASLTIEQRSDVASYGTWLLVPPSGNDYRSNSREERRTLGNLPEGLYTLQVDSPEGATTTIRLLENGVVRESITGERMTFALDAADTATIQIAYTYIGTITVESTPAGASFELSGPSSMRFTGTTPDTFRELPPGYYSVNFGIRAGCTVPRPIRRDLGANEQVTFLGEYRCGSASSSSSSSRVSSASSRSPISSSPRVSARVVHTVRQAEVLPGGSVRITVGVVNTSKSTLSDLMLSEQFDPSVVSIVELPADAIRQGNMIIWKIDSIYAGQRWSADIVVQAAKSAPAGTTALTARLSGDALDGTPSGQLASTVTLGIATLPATGGAFDVLLAMLGLLVPAPALLAARRRL